MAADASIVARIGGDATGLVGALDKAKGSVRQFGEGVGKIADGIAKKFEFRDVARTLATALGLNLQNIANQVARFVIGFTEGAEKALEETIARTEKAADNQERRLERARALKKTAQEEYIKLLEDEEKLLLKFRLSEQDRQREKAAAMVKAEEEAGFAADLEWVKEQDRIAAEKKLKAQQIEELKALEIQANEEIAKVEQARVAEKFKSMVDQWKGFLVTVTRTGRGDTELSDRELQRKKDTITKDLSEMERKGRETGAYQGGDYFQRLELNAVNQELALRQKVRQYTATFGEDRAFQLAGVSEQRFAEINQTNTKLDDVNSTLKKIERRLDGGILTLPTNVIKNGGG